MHPRFATRTAMGLMWHADSKWSNALWWLRGLCSLIVSCIYRLGSVFRRRPSWTLYSPSGPGALWYFLSLTTLLLFVSIPLSGITMELQDAFVLGSRQAPILGPHPASLNRKGPLAVYELVRANWRSGRPTTPGGNTILYAPAGTPRVSTSYYEDQIRSSKKNYKITIFAGPAVEEVVHGNAWGLEVNITCSSVAKDALKLISVTDFGNHTFARTTPYGKHQRSVKFINETGVNYYITAYSLLVATETSHAGTSDGSGFYVRREKETR